MSRKKSTINGNQKFMAIMFMIGTLFFWYYALNHLWYWLYDNPGFTQTGAFIGSMVSVGSAMVYAYFIYDIIKSNRFDIKRSMLLLFLMVAFSAFIFVWFPIAP